jgi:predicted nucleic acid-binding protein
MIVLDTNVVSELMRPEPAEPVVSWVSSQPATSQYTTTITQSEILYGILLLAAGKRRARLLSAADCMFAEDFAGRVLGFGSDAATLYARIAADRRRAGRPISHFDAQIAAIARANGAKIVTRNIADFHGCGVELVDPWKS